MSSTSPFKRKELSIQTLENIPKTFEDLKLQKTYRTILDSDTHFTLDESRKTISGEFKEQSTQIKESNKQNVVSSFQKMAQSRQIVIQKLQQSLYLEKGINQSLREQILQNKYQINQLVTQLQQTTGNTNKPLENEAQVFDCTMKNKKDQPISAPNFVRFPKMDVQLQNSRLKKHISFLQQSLRQCKALLIQVEQKSRVIQNQYESDIKLLKLRNQYLQFQIPSFH